MNISKYWTDSIEWQDNSSDGLLQKSFTTRWVHRLSDSEEEGSDYIYSQGHVIEPGTTYKIMINMEGSTAAVFGRYLGCMMVGFMPDEGLGEALFSLRDILEFYNHKPEPRPARLSPKTIVATIGDRKKRPDLVIT